jgi:hypothetical protein
MLHIIIIALFLDVIFEKILKLLCGAGKNLETNSLFGTEPGAAGLLLHQRFSNITSIFIQFSTTLCHPSSKRKQLASFSIFRR